MVRPIARRKAHDFRTVVGTASLASETSDSSSIAGPPLEALAKEKAASTTQGLAEGTEPNIWRRSLLRTGCDNGKDAQGHPTHAQGHPSSRPKPARRPKPLLFKLAIVYVPLRPQQFMCCRRLIVGRPAAIITPMHTFTIMRVETLDDRQHGPGGQASAPSELPCPHLPNRSSRRYNRRWPRPRLRAGGRLLLRCLLLLA